MTVKWTPPRAPVVWLVGEKGGRHLSSLLLLVNFRFSVVDRMPPYHSYMFMAAHAQVELQSSS